jgi:hypothetical protein
MDKYGFTQLTRDEARQMKLPEGSGMFSELFNAMENEVKRNPEKENDYKDALYMREYEKDISFLNRFFIYKKTSTRNAEKLTKALLDQLPDEIAFEQAGTMLAREAVEDAEEIIKPKAKKLIQKKTRTKKAKPAIQFDIVEGEELIDIVPKKKTTRRKKIVEIIDEDDDN